MAEMKTPPDEVLRKIREHLAYCPLTGVVYWRTDPPHKTWGRKRAGDPVVVSMHRSNAGHDYKSARCSAFGRHFQLSRLIWFLAYGDWPTHVIDHIDGDTRNNRLCNLRAADHAMNAQNQRRPNRKNTTGYLGVLRRGKKFTAQIEVNGKRKESSVCDTAHEAHLKYIEMKRKFHPGCTI